MSPYLNFNSNWRTTSEVLSPVIYSSSFEEIGNNCSALLADRYKNHDGITAVFEFHGTNCLFMSREAFKSKTKTQLEGIKIFIQL